jgi:hypothetical protein
MERRELLIVPEKICWSFRDEELGIVVDTN